MKKSILSLVIVFCFFISLEAGARIQDMIFDDLHFFNQAKPVVYKEGLYLPAVPIPNLGVSIQGHFYQHNSKGFRGDEFSFKKPADIYRIVCLGGSSTYGNQLSNNETWPVQLENLLNNTGLRKNIEVINAGVGGYTTRESLINLLIRVLPLEPDMIIIYHAYNDFKPNRYPGFKFDYTHWRSRERMPGKHILNILSSKSSFLRNTVALYRKTLGYLNKTGKHNFKIRRLRAYDTISESGIEAFKRNLKAMIYVARREGIIPVMSTFSLTLNEENLERYPQKFQDLRLYIPTLTFQGILDAKQKYNEAIREVARKENCVFINNSSLIPEDFKYHYDTCHFTPAGARLAAENFAKGIAAYLKGESN